MRDDNSQVFQKRGNKSSDLKVSSGLQAAEVPGAIHQSIEVGKSTGNGHSGLDKHSRDFDNIQQVLSHDQQRKMIRDKYLQAGYQQHQQLGSQLPLGLGSSKILWESPGTFSDKQFNFSR